MPFILLTIYDQYGLTPLDGHSLWTYFGGTYFAYVAAPVAIPIFWLLALWTKAPQRFWAIVPLLATLFSFVFMAITRTLDPAVWAFCFVTLGLPIALAYGLLVGASWRIRGTPQH